MQVNLFIYRIRSTTLCLLAQIFGILELKCDVIINRIDTWGRYRCGLVKSIRAALYKIVKLVPIGASSSWVLSPLHLTNHIFWNESKQARNNHNRWEPANTLHHGANSFVVTSCVISGVEFWDVAFKVLQAADAYRHAVEVQEKCRSMPERTSEQLDLKIKKLTQAEERLASIKSDIDKMK